MKSRSEVIRTRSEAKAEPKPSAAERTIPLPKAPPGATIRCESCEAVSPADQCTVRNDGTAECPECGAPLDLAAASTRVDAAPPKPEKKPPTTAEMVAEVEAKKKPEPPKRYCGACGVEMPWAASTYFYACGHTKEEAGMADDPRKARGAKPPAPHTTRTEVEIARRNAADAASGNPSVQVGATTSIRIAPPTETIPTHRLSIHWGKARCPVDRFNSFEVGGHIVTVDLPEGADRVETAKKILEDLEKIAEESFKKQHAWYIKKLGILGVE